MGFSNPPRPWSEIDAILSDAPSSRGRDGRAPGSAAPNGGGDGPALGRRRQPYEPPPGVGGEAAGASRRPSGDRHVAYAELHCHSNFSFLDGASAPEELVAGAFLRSFIAMVVATFAIIDTDRRDTEAALAARNREARSGKAIGRCAGRASATSNPASATSKVMRLLRRCCLSSCCLRDTMLTHDRPARGCVGFQQRGCGRLLHSASSKNHARCRPVNILQ